MMINIISLRCSLAFAPYLSVSAAEFLAGGAIAPLVVRQGGSALILRSHGDLVLRHEHRQATLGIEDVRHFAATIQMRTEFYDVSRMQDEVVLASVGGELLLSHPQSDMWLTPDAVGALASAFARESKSRTEGALLGIPEWLKVSTGGGRLLLSDQRTGRWVLLGEDHVRELERRLGTLRQPLQTAAGPPPVTISVKGLTVHLASAFTLLSTLLDFARNRHVTPFEEITANFSLKASACTEGIELTSADERIALTAREAEKWASIVRNELERLSARRFDRGGIRTVFARNEDGCWVLQWGDEVFLSRGVLGRGSRRGALSDATRSLIGKDSGEFLLLLSPATGACVALTDSESQFLSDFHG